MSDWVLALKQHRSFGGGGEGRKEEGGRVG